MLRFLALVLLSAALVGCSNLGVDPETGEPDFTFPTFEQRCANYRAALTAWQASPEATADRGLMIGVLSGLINANCPPLPPPVPAEKPAE